MKRAPTMSVLVDEYLAFRRSLGFALRVEGAELQRFARYAAQVGHRGSVTTDLALRWAKLPRDANPLYWARRLDVVRRFAKHRVLFDPATEVPPDGLLGPSYRRPVPHIYSDGELGALLRAASKLGPPGGLRSHTYSTVFGLMAATGLRISEVVRLTKNHVDLNAGVLTVVETKFQKSRLVPLHSSVTQVLRRYAKRREDYHPSVEVEAFFLTERGTALKDWRVRITFSLLRVSLGWIRQGTRSAPRIHDLRHTFVVRRLLQWYRDGVDIGQCIATLSTYLGHVKVSDTYWYLSAVPELLAAASLRYERAAGRIWEKGDE